MKNVTKLLSVALALTAMSSQAQAVRSVPAGNTPLMGKFLLDLPGVRDALPNGDEGFSITLSGIDCAGHALGTGTKPGEVDYYVENARCVFDPVTVGKKNLGKINLGQSFAAGWLTTALISDPLNVAIDAHLGTYNVQVSEISCAFNPDYESSQEKSGGRPVCNIQGTFSK